MLLGHPQARFIHNIVKWDIFGDFQTLWHSFFIFLFDSLGEKATKGNASWWQECRTDGDNLTEVNFVLN